MHASLQGSRTDVPDPAGRFIRWFQLRFHLKLISRFEISQQFDDCAKSSLSEVRGYFVPEYLNMMFRQTVDVYFLCEDLPKFLKKYVMIAIDATKCNLNSSDCNKEKYGWFCNEYAR
jgi:hypothetical protein